MFHKSQCGRSMIEMLGVLAIVGVLSVGGLAGYSKAMRANKINDALEYINRAKIEYYARLANGTQASDTAISCSTLLGESFSAYNILNCSCRNKNVYVRMKTIDLLKELALRVNATNYNGTKDPVTEIDNYVNAGQEGRVCLVLCRKRTVVGGWDMTYGYCI